MRPPSQSRPGAGWPTSLVAAGLVAMLAAGLPVAQEAGVPAPVLKKRDDLRTALESGSSVRQVLTREEATPWIVKIIRGYRRAATSWQLDSAAVSAMGDSQITDFVVERAQHLLTCTTMLWTRVSLAEGFDPDADVVRQLQAEMTPAGAAGAYRVGPDCVTLLDNRDEPAVIRTPQQAAEVLAFERRFADSVAPRLSLQSLTAQPTYRANTAYFTTAFAASLAEDRGFSQAVLRAKVGLTPEVQVFRFSMTNLSLYLSYEPAGNASRLLFLAPFSW